MCTSPSKIIAPEVSPDQKSLSIPDGYRTTDAQHLELPKKVTGESPKARITRLLRTSCLFQCFSFNLSSHVGGSQEITMLRSVSSISF